MRVLWQEGNSYLFLKKIVYVDMGWHMKCEHICSVISSDTVLGTDLRFFQ